VLFPEYHLTRSNARPDQPVMHLTLLSPLQGWTGAERRLFALGISAGQSRTVTRDVRAITSEANLGQEIVDRGALPRISARFNLGVFLP
jgi:hypothetical protein